jgi:hypothetical protein
MTCIDASPMTRAVKSSLAKISVEAPLALLQPGKLMDDQADIAGPDPRCIPGYCGRTAIVALLTEQPATGVAIKQ